MKRRTNSRKNTVKSSQKKYIFTLKGINTEKIDQRFGITLVSNINIGTDDEPTNTTKISDLSASRNTPEIISFIDEAKKSHKCTISMVDFETQKKFSAGGYNRGYDCFWCRNSIPPSVVAIGCPIKYVPSQAVKTYYSEISKDTYTIKESITPSRKKKIEESNDSRLVINEKDYYLTDGIFCSFNCCMAYISENREKSIYSMSEMLLLKMYNNIYPNKVPCIQEAPHWRLLKQCGGHLTIKQFRESFSKIEYQEHGSVNVDPVCKSLGVLYEEKLKF